MDDRPLRDEGMHPEIGPRVTDPTNRPQPHGTGSPELRIIRSPADDTVATTQPDFRADAERLRVVAMDPRRHLLLVLDSHRRRADALAAINRENGLETSS